MEMYPAFWWMDDAMNIKHLMLLLFASVLAAACQPLKAAPATATLSPAPDRSSIFYIDYDADQRAFRLLRIALDSPTAHLVRLLTPPPGAERWFFEPAPDFSWIAYYAETQPRLVLVSQDGSEQREITLPAPPGMVLWSPDGQKLLAAGRIWDTRGAWLADMPPGLLTDCAWAGDSLALACSMRDAQSGLIQGVWVAPVAGVPYLLTSDLERGAKPVFSPDGQRVAYFRLPDNTLIIRDRQGADPQEIYPPYPLFQRDRQSRWMPPLAAALPGWLSLPAAGWGNLNVSGPLAWSPDGRQIAFDCDALCIADVSTKKISVYRDGQPHGVMSAIDWSPDGAYLTFAFTGPTDPDRRVIVHANTMTGAALPDGAQAVAWSPDSTRLAFSTVDGVSLIRADGSGHLLLAEGRHISWLIWQP